MLRAVVLLTLLSACGRPDCSLEKAVKEAAGPDAVACGGATLDDHAAVGACMAGALADGKAFWGYRQGPGLDSTLGYGVACDGTHLWLFAYDGCPHGCRDGDPHLYRSPCSAPQAADDWITCQPADREQVCPPP